MQCHANVGYPNASAPSAIPILSSQLPQDAAPMSTAHQGLCCGTWRLTARARALSAEASRPGDAATPMHAEAHARSAWAV